MLFHQCPLTLQTVSLLSLEVPVSSYGLGREKKTCGLSGEGSASWLLAFCVPEKLAARLQCPLFEGRKGNKKAVGLPFPIFPT